MLEALEAFGPAALFRTSFVLYPLVNALHILAIGVLVTAALLMDLRILGVARQVPAETVIRRLRPVAVVRFAVARLSGIVLFSMQPVDLSPTRPSPSSWLYSPPRSQMLPPSPHSASTATPSVPWES